MGSSSSCEWRVRERLNKAPRVQIEVQAAAYEHNESIHSGGKVGGELVRPPSVLFSWSAWHQDQGDVRCVAGMHIDGHAVRRIPRPLGDFIAFHLVAT